MNRHELIELAENPDFISGIYNYCDRWCEKCPFTSRCRVYATEAADGDLDDPEVHDINNEKFWRKLESIFREAHEKMAVWAEEAGVDLESTESQAAVAEHEQREQEADEHQLAELARQYAMTVQEWFAEEFVTEQNMHDDMMVDADGAAEIDVAGAAEVLRWYQFFVAAKVIRALMSRTLSDHSLVETTAGDNPFAEEVWRMATITSVSERLTRQGKPFRDASARNASGSLALKVWAEVLEGREELKSGLWGVTGKLESFQDRSQVVVTEYKPITIEKYREHQNAEPVLPRAFTMDIETLALPGFRDRVGPKLEKDLKLGYMRLEQQQRYLEDIAAEEERVYQLGSLNATSGRILSIAVHIGPVPGFAIEGVK